jgi:hypothetical protein
MPPCGEKPPFFMIYMSMNLFGGFSAWGFWWIKLFEREFALLLNAYHLNFSYISGQDKMKLPPLDIFNGQYEKLRGFSG